MTEGLGDFFKLIAENKREIAEEKRKEEKKLLEEKQEQDQMINDHVDMGLDDIFGQLGVQPKKERANKNPVQIVNEEKEKKEEFDRLISSVISVMETGNTPEPIQEEVEEEVISEEDTESKQEKILTFFESFLTKKINDIEEIKEEIIEEPEEVVEEVVEEVTAEQPKEESLMERSLGLLSEPSEVVDIDKNFATLDDLQSHYKGFLSRIQQQLSTLGGGGETRLEFLDDVDRDSAKVDGRVLAYQASTGKFIGTTNSGGGGGSGITTASVRDSIQGYYGYTTDYYTVGVANTTQEIGAGVTTLVQPQVASVYQYMPTIMSGINTNPYVGTAATVGTGQTEFSLAGLTAGASCIVRTALAFDPDDDNSNLDIQLKFTTNTATQGTGLTNFTIKKEQALIMNEGANQQYISENLFSFFVGTTLEGTTQSDAGSFSVEVIPTSDGELEVLAVTVNVVA